MRAARVRPWGYAAKNYHLNLFKVYKLTQQAWEELWEQQDGCCAICKVELAHPVQRVINKEGAEVFVDHLHEMYEKQHQSEAKKVRGLLCFNCNLFLGVIKESHVFLENALKYLQQKGTSTFREETVPKKRAQVKETKVQEYEEQWIKREDGTSELIRIPL